MHIIARSYVVIPGRSQRVKYDDEAAQSSMVPGNLQAPLQITSVTVTPEELRCHLQVLS